MTKAMYVPAIGEQFNSAWHRGKKYIGKDGKEYDLKFFTDQSHFQMNIALQSCYYAINGLEKKTGEKFRDVIKYPKEKTLLGDSAGFQLASFKLRGEVCNIEPIDSLRWQEANCDVGMNLDFPPSLSGEATYEEFMEALEVSYNNFKFFEENRKRYDDFKLLNVLHGQNYKLMDIWYNKVKDFKFDGWALAAKPSTDPIVQAFGFMFLWEKGEFQKESCRWLHFFGTSGKHVAPVICYAASKLNIPVTYDSSSYNVGSIYRTYYFPFDIGPHLGFGEKFKYMNPHLKELPCKCPVCVSIKDINDMNTGDIFAGTLVSLHNLYQYHYYNDILNSIVKDKELFLDYLNKINASDRALKGIEFIDYAMEKGVENALEKYKEYFIAQDLVKCKQANIWGF